MYESANFFPDDGLAAIFRILVVHHCPNFVRLYFHRLFQHLITFCSLLANILWPRQGVNATLRSTMSTEIYEGSIAVRGKGVGFFTLPEQAKDAEDILVVRENLGTALDGDTVTLELLPPEAGERRQGRVTSIVERKRAEYIGIVKKGDEGYYLHPDDGRMYVRPQLAHATSADEGMKVVAKLAAWSDPMADPAAEILEVLGRAGDHETEMQAIIRTGGHSQHFVPEIASAADELYARREQIFAAAIEETKKPEGTRVDLRDRLTFTIDPHDAKDFDDALSITQLENGNFEIGIHIADVSHYVEEGGLLDKEAADRATSIYLVDRVIPMLPEVLSNDLCSLRPHEDRLAFSAVFEMTPQAEVVNEWYNQTIIHSDRRFTYEEAQDILDAGEGDHAADLKNMMALARILRDKRYKNGAIAFEQPEVKFELDTNGYPIAVHTKVRTETMMMIEDFMLLCNQRVAKYVNKLCKDRGQECVYIYRIHDTPDPEKIMELATFLHALGFELKNEHGEVKARDINAMLTDIEGSPNEELLKVVTIRSMAKAVYSTANIGHFGLAFDNYSHFTSPIRRYPDLIAHRLLRKYLDKVPVGKKEQQKVEAIAKHSSEREQFAVRSERDSIKYKQVEFMLGKIGQTFEGTITGVADWGMYVEEKNSKAEGLIHISKLGKDFFTNEASKYRIKGERSGETFTLGQSVRMKLIGADLEERKIDWELVK